MQIIKLFSVCNVLSMILDLNCHCNGDFYQMSDFFRLWDIYIAFVNRLLYNTFYWSVKLPLWNTIYDVASIIIFLTIYMYVFFNYLKPFEFVWGYGDKM